MKKAKAASTKSVEPSEHKAYGCSFGCGRKRTTNRGNMVRHMGTCWSNPDLKGCMTCRHEELVREYDVYGTVGSNYAPPGCPGLNEFYRVCHHPIIGREMQFPENKFSPFGTPYRNCFGWDRVMICRSLTE